RMLAAEALGDIGPRAKAAIPALRKALKDDDADVRLAAAGALARLDRTAEEPLPILIGSLKEQTPEMFDPSLERKLASLGKLAIPALIELIRDRGKQGLTASPDSYYRAAEA